jgi:uncharacterized SAM-binding protein YcdF (DUF218 family)
LTHQIDQGRQHLEIKLIMRVLAKRWMRKKSLWVIGVALTLSFCFRFQILMAAGRAWLVPNTASNADAIYILGGNLDTRPFKSAAFFQEKLAPLVLIPTVEASPAEALGVTVSQAAAAQEILVKQNVPSAAIQLIPANVSSTYEEAEALLRYLQQHPEIKKVLIPTEDYHARRTRWVFRRVIPENLATCSVIPSPHLEFDSSHWWQSEEGLITFQNELIKMVYYYCKY